ncbi:TetR/AcrR family transcriptional regulator [Streptococcus thermophilus]|uniref:TetR/AcrR family transcriptional regulator n=1 Tax=Streptococcus thermophilus TaxID=1308 RepID=UPI003A7FED0B
MTLGTHENIINAFFRIAAKKDARLITMSEIASEAHISRQAIYQKHFRTVDEIIDEIHQIIYQNTYSILNNFNPSHSTLNEYIAHELLPRLYQHRDWLRILHSSNIDYNWQLFISKHYLPIIYPHLDEISSQLKISKDFLALFIIKYYEAIISSWLLQDLPMPPEVFGKYFLQLVDIPITDYFDF